MVFLVAIRHCQQSTTWTATPERRPLERRTLMPIMVPFVKATFVLATFVHIRFILNLPKIFWTPNFWTQICFGPIFILKFFDYIFLDLIFVLNFLIFNFLDLFWGPKKCWVPKNMDKKNQGKKRLKFTKWKLGSYKIFVSNKAHINLTTTLSLTEVWHWRPSLVSHCSTSPTFDQSEAEKISKTEGDA